MTLKLTERTVTCLTCRHYDVIVIPPAEQPTQQCWSPLDRVIGAYYFVQEKHGWGSVVLDCLGHEPHLTYNQSGR